MSTEATYPTDSYLSGGWDLKSWLLTKDHKRIGILYLLSISAMFVLGGLYAGLIRWNLLVPDGSHMSADTYNKTFTAHGVIMVFFFLIPSIPAVLGNFLIPLMIGAKDLAFPKLNLLSWYLYVLGAGITLYALLAGGLDTGWTFYTPYSTVFAQSNVEFAAIGIFVAGFSSILTGLNFIVTIHKMRAPGMTWFRMPLFVWAHYATAIIQVLGTPVVAITILLVALERIFHFGFFDPNRGGDPILFQHLFWFYSHPAVYIMILPSMGVISELITCFSRKRVFGYSFIAMSSLAIAAIGFLVWAHHMFVSGMAVYSAMVFSALTYLVAIPSAIKTFNWTATLYKGSISWDTPMIYVFCFLGLFLIGGLTGLFLGNLGTDVHLTDTYFVVAHFHYIMVGGAIMGYLGGLHFWWPKITGRKYSEAWARLSAVLIFVGFNLTFFPQFLLGYLGHAPPLPRVPRGVPGPERALDRRGHRARLRLPLPVVLPPLLALQGRAGGSEPVGGQGPRVDDHLAAAHRELPRDPGGDRGGLRLREGAEGGRRCLSSSPMRRPGRTTGTTRRSSTSSRTSSSRRRPPPSGCGSSSPRRSCSSGASSPPTPSTAASTRPPSRRAATTSAGRSASPTRSSSSARASPWPWPSTRRRSGKRSRIVGFLLATVLLGGVFLGVKYFEYGEKIRPCLGDGPYAGCLVPGERFDASALHLEGAEGGHAQIYFSLYFGMTGLHALHMIIGIPIILGIAFRSWRGAFTPEYHTPVELVGLYWHFVDIIWIFLFPLLYLIGAH